MMNHTMSQTLSSFPQDEDTTKDNLMLILCTAPDLKTAKQLAQSLFEKKLVACINLIPHITSMYQWEGQLCEEQEVQIVLKTAHDHFAAVEQLLLEQHPYDCPEIIGFSSSVVTKEYHAWLKASL